MQTTGHFVQGTYYPIRCGLSFLRLFMNFQGQTLFLPLNSFHRSSHVGVKPDARCQMPHQPSVPSPLGFTVVPGSSSQTAFKYETPPWSERFNPDQSLSTSALLIDVICHCSSPSYCFIDLMSALLKFYQYHFSNDAIRAAGVPVTSRQTAQA